jgi:hypothetical protein
MVVVVVVVVVVAVVVVVVVVVQHDAQNLAWPVHYPLFLDPLL